jgi:hypothetical protein
MNTMNPVVNISPAGVNNQTGAIWQGVNTPVQENRPCPACDEISHVPRDCKNRKNRKSTSLAANFGRGTGLSVHRIITLYLFKTITLLLKTRYGWKGWILNRSITMKNQIYRIFMMRKKKLT